jgi:hypothetical protein
MLLFLILPGNFFRPERVCCQVSENDPEIISNLNIADRLIEESLLEVANELAVLGIDKLYSIEINGQKGSKEYFDQKTRQIFSGYRIIYDTGHDSVNYNIYIREAVITPRYNRIFTSSFLGTRRVEREILVKFDARIENAADKKVIFEKKFVKRFKDDFDLDKQLFIEDRRFEFTNAQLPEEGFLNRIIVPAVVILASAVAIILFFTIRSK